MARVTLRSRIPQLIRDAERNGYEAMRLTVFEIEAEAKMRSRVRTGEMRAGWEGRLTGPYEGKVSNAVRHAVYNEFGTRYMSAQPMLVPAVESARERFERAVARIYR